MWGLDHRKAQADQGSTVAVLGCGSLENVEKVNVVKGKWIYSTSSFLGSVSVLRHPKTSIALFWFTKCLEDSHLWQISALFLPVLNRGHAETHWWGQQSVLCPHLRLQFLDQLQDWSMTGHFPSLYTTSLWVRRASQFHWGTNLFCFFQCCIKNRIFFGMLLK